MRVFGDSIYRMKKPRGARRPTLRGGRLDISQTLKKTVASMAEQPKANDLMERIVSLCKRHGLGLFSVIGDLRRHQWIFGITAR